VQAVKSKFSTELKVWDKLRIIVGDGRQAGHYDTRVEELINGGVVVSDPVFISGHTLLRNNVPVIVQITRADAAYQFHSRVRVSGEKSPRRIILTPPRRFQRVQRRMFARVELHNRVSYSRLPDSFDWEDWEKRLSWQQSRASNISAGGILLELREPVKTNDLLILKISLLAEFELPSTLPARVRRVFTHEEKRYAGVEYILAEQLEDNFSKQTIRRLPNQLKNFGYHQQDRLVSILFHKQIELRLKGLI
jgi:c-di-GMP-binding flagellar brake protein YcgR